MKSLIVMVGMSVMAMSSFVRATEAPNSIAPMTRIDSGTLVGSEKDGVRTFFGIPYAAPPIGNGRWRAPQPVASWKAPRNAQQFGSACMQSSTIGGMPLPAEFADMSEDCLFLNVWAPATSGGKRLPVLVWIHGSGFLFGAGRGFGIDGTSFAKHGVIVVSMNYRLGVFGQFAHPALENDGSGGNFALLDLIAALRWVNRNIGSFGGDPAQVTLAGLSAGGTYAQILTANPAAKGLFRQVIVQSGPLFFDWPTLEEARLYGLKTLAAQPSATADALRAVPAKDVAAATSYDDAHGPWPIIDGAVIADHPSRLLERATLNAQAMIVGSTSLEGLMRVMSPVPLAVTDRQMIDSLKIDDARIQALYNPTGTKNAKQIATDIDGDRNFGAGARYAARVMSNRGVAVFEYQFSYVPEANRARLAAAPHSSDQHFVFNRIASTMWGPRASAADKAMAETLHAYWISFIKTGNPNGTGRPEWPRYEKSSDKLLEFATTGPAIREGHWRERLDVAEAALLRER